MNETLQQISQFGVIPILILGITALGRVVVVQNKEKKELNKYIDELNEEIKTLSKESVALHYKTMEVLNKVAENDGKTLNVMREIKIKLDHERTR